MWFDRILNRGCYLLSIDGGTSTVGIAKSLLKDGKLTILETHLFDVSREVNQVSQFHVLRHGELSARLSLLKGKLNDYLNAHPEIQAVIYEQHFINPRRPTSVIPLARFMQCVESVCDDRGIYIEYIPPQLMKKQVGVTKLNKATKDDVKDAIVDLIHRKKIYLNNEIRIHSISEHEVDAIGIAYAYLANKQYLG